MLGSIDKKSPTTRAGQSPERTTDKKDVGGLYPYQPLPSGYGSEILIHQQGDYTQKHIFFLVEEANGARSLRPSNPFDDRVVTWRLMTT